MMLRQVKLSRRSTRGHIEDVVWIDNELAKPGKRVQDEDGVVWTIEAVYGAKSFEDVNKTMEQWREFARKLEGH